MAFQVPGYYDFGNVLRAQEETNLSSRYAAQGLINLGKSISASISEKNMRKEADAMAPILQMQYQKGFSNIANGNIGQGMADIVGVSAIAGTNPLLKRMADDMVRAGTWMTNNVLKSRLEQQRMEIMDNMSRMAHERRMTEIGARNQSSSSLPRPIDPKKQFSDELRYRNTYLTAREKMINQVKDYASQGSVDSAINAIERLADLDSEAVAILGERVQRPNPIGFLSEEDQLKYSELVNKYQEVTQKIESGQTRAGLFGGSLEDERQKIDSELKKFVNKKLKPLEDAIQRRYDALEAEASVAQQEMPVLNPDDPNLPDYDLDTGLPIGPGGSEQEILIPPGNVAPPASTGAVKRARDLFY